MASVCSFAAIVQNGGFVIVAVAIPCVAIGDWCQMGDVVAFFFNFDLNSRRNLDPKK